MPPSSLSSPPPSPKKRIVVKPGATQHRVASGSRSGLPADSLALSLLLAAKVIAAVRAGQSLTAALAALTKEMVSTRAAAQDVAYGTLRSYGRGEFILRRLLQRPLTHPETEALLLAAIYRLQTRPDAPHTVVDQAVLAAGDLAAGAFKGLVNGLLRNYLRQHDTLHAAMGEDDEAMYQHPRWWLARLRRAYPDHWRDIVAVDNAPPPMSLRVNRRRVAVADYATRLAAAGLGNRQVLCGALLLESPVTVEKLPGFGDGLVSVQDAGAQQAAALLQPRNGERVLDACAAPGGKSAHLLELADIDLLALDIDAARTQRIGDNLRRLGLAAKVVVADCRDTATWWDGKVFDAILADVPCSASGVVRRHPDGKYLRRESDIRRFAALQAEILDRLWSLLKPGGRFLYATCSVFPEENGAQIDAFLFRQRNAKCLDQKQLLPLDQHDGFFYALLGKAA